MRTFESEKEGQSNNSNREEHKLTKMPMCARHVGDSNGQNKRLTSIGNKRATFTRITDDPS